MLQAFAARNVSPRSEYSKCAAQRRRALGRDTESI